MGASFLAWLAERLGAAPGQVDLMLVRMGEAGELQIELEETDGVVHPWVARATRYRTDLRVFVDEGRRGVLLVGRGLAGRWEMAFEVEPDDRGHGLGCAWPPGRRV